MCQRLTLGLKGAIPKKKSNNNKNSKNFKNIHMKIFSKVENKVYVPYVHILTMYPCNLDPSLVSLVGNTKKHKNNK